MADAKSRYEIVNELTEKKTGILDTITTLKTRVEDNKAQIEQMKRTQERHKAETIRKHNVNIEALDRDNTATIEDADEGHKLLEANTSTKIAELDKKVAALNEAVDAIKAISGGIDSKTQA